MAETSAPSPARPGIALGLTFLFVGLTFALPFALVPDTGVSLLSGKFSPEVANVYACVAWAGWAHFLYAFRGQGGALARMRDAFRKTRLLSYAGCLGGIVAILAALRWVSGPSIFGAAVWIYFIDHFIKAEHVFEGKSPSESSLVRWLASYQTLLAFGWLSVVLLNVGSIDSRPWILWTISTILAGTVLVFGGWRKLSSGESRGPLLSLFFVAEALVWGTFSRYGGPVFLTGVYVFHIAAGSYYHYLGSYIVAAARTGGKDRMLSPWAIVGVNVTIVALGCAVAYVPELSWLRPVLGIEWFSLWVAVHLIASDAFPYFKAKLGSNRAPRLVTEKAALSAD